MKLIYLPVLILNKCLKAKNIAIFLIHGGH